MVYSKGTKVRLIHTGDLGEVEEWLEHDLIAVRLSDGEVIPVMVEALERIVPETPSKVKAKFVPGKKKVEPLPLQPLPTDSQYMVLKPQGLQLAFDPVNRPDGRPDYYRIYLINDTQLNFLYQLSLQLRKQSVWKTQGRLGPRTMVECGSLRFAELNESAVIEVETWRLLPDGKGTGQRLSRLLKLKPTQFFKKLTTAPYLNRPVILYALFSEKELNQKKESPKTITPKQSLQSYTNQANEEQKDKKKWYNLQEMPHEVWELATFKNEIDLHLDSLVDDPTTIQKGQILEVQLSHFEAFMERAVRLGVERVFVIHGVGEGKLRDTIKRRLQNMPEVKSFKNEYHGRYGYGATEVIL